jgi:hypothetical protein
VPFIANLPPLPLPLWQRIDIALTNLNACLANAPSEVERIEDDVAYVEQLVVVLKELGAAIAAARLKDDVGNPHSWPHESQAESWARALVERGFDPGLTSQKLIAWLGQTISGGDRPGGDPVFFALMRGSLSQFAEALREKTRPKGSATPYDPVKSQPRTLGELERWMLANEASRRGAMVPCPVPLNQPPKWPPIPGVDQLTAYCNAHFGTHLSYDAVIKIRGRYCLTRGVSPAEADAMPLKIVADALVSDFKIVHGRSDEHPFLEELRHREQRKADTAKAATQRQQLLQPLVAAVHRVDDGLYKIQGPEKPSEPASEETAAELFEAFKQFRAAMQGLGIAEALEAFRRESTQPNERQWLLDAILHANPAEEIATVLRKGDRSELYKAWQDLAADCWNRRPLETPSREAILVPPTMPPSKAGDKSAPSTARVSAVGQSACSFRWLHLTDLHFGMPGQKWLWPSIQEEFYTDLERLHRKAGPWDLVLFTGDFVQRGSAKEFEDLESVLSRLWTHLRTLGSDPVLLGVPGNHDLRRPKPENPAVTSLRTGWTDPHLQKQFWEKPGSAYRKAVQQALKNYDKWWQAQDFSGLHEFKFGLLPGEFSATVSKNGYTLGLVGLNTTYLQLGGGAYEGQLALSPQQFHEACGGDGPAWTRQNHVCLLLTHHPPSWLMSQSQNELYSEIAIPGRFAAHLFGHMHEPLVRSVAQGGAATRREWQGASLFGLEEWGEEGSKKSRRHGYSAGQVELLGQTGRIQLWPRKAESQQAGHLRIVPDLSFTLNSDEATEAESFQLSMPHPRV